MLPLATLVSLIFPTPYLPKSQIDDNIYQKHHISTHYYSSRFD